MAADELDRRRFGIVVESVYFHQSGQGLGCAVLLKTCFELLAKDRLLTALVPLSAGPNKSEAGETVSTEDINISSSYPTETEWFEVAEREESKESSFMPSVNVNAAGNGVQLSGMGKSWRSSHVQSYKIKLDPSKTLFEGLPTLLKLKYEDEAGLFYPPSVSVLVMVEKCTDEFDPGWFPFLLNLDWRLKVDIHGSDGFAKFKRLVAKPSKHDGWRFQIKGNFNPERAKEALQDSVTNREPSSHMDVGLRVAARRWAESSPNLQGKGKGKAKEN